MSKDGMNERRKKFVAAYLKTLNASEAARQAGYKQRADVAGARLMVNSSIKAAISKHISEAMSAERDSLKRRIVEELQAEAFADSVFVDETKGGTVTKANPNKIKALELLSKYLGMLTDKVEHTGADGGPINIVWPSQAKD